MASAQPLIEKKIKTCLSHKNYLVDHMINMGVADDFDESLYTVSLCSLNVVVRSTE